MDTPPLAGQTLLLTRQRHEADRAGLHWDYRIVAGDKAYSWATKKPMPGPGSAIILHEQPVHTSHYALSKEVVIPPGEYGAGKTTLDFVRKVTVGDHADNDHMTLHLKSGDRYLLKKLDAADGRKGGWAGGGGMDCGADRVVVRQPRGLWARKSWGPAGGLGSSLPSTRMRTANGSTCAWQGECHCDRPCSRR